MYLARTLVTLVAALSAPGLLAAQHGGPHPAAQDTSAAPLYGPVLGPFRWPVSAGSAEAQAYFDEGVKLMFAFAPRDALRSFREARRRNPRCGMCWWGEAWSLGPYLNGPMRDADAPAAHAAIRQARRLAAGTTPVERALVEAMASRYAPAHGPAGRRGLDSAYATAMARVYERFPDHLEVATLYADALMLLEPRRGTWPLAKPSVARIHQVLERALARDISHPGACHLYIHATESTPRVGQAQRCADLLGSAIPGASHINHMPSHTYNRVGRWGDAVRANVVAIQSDRKARHGQGFAIYPLHNLHMLLFAASVDGQGAVAMQAARDYARQVPNGDGAALHALTLVRFGRFDEVLEVTAVPQHPLHRGLWAFARGHAHLRLERRDSARAYAALVDSLAAHTPAATTFRGHTARPLLGTVGGILRGELLRAEGRPDEAIATLEAAVRLEDELTYDEPEPLPFAARDWLGAALLDAGRAPDAERVYRAALDDRPANGWSLLGLEQALRAQGRGAEAERVAEELRQAWARSDTWLRASRF